jgi:hypothetical protein
MKQASKLERKFVRLNSAPARAPGQNCNFEPKENDMNELFELGMLAGEAKSAARNDSRDDGLVELGLVVAETKGHCHGSLPDGGSLCKTTSPF